MPKSATSRERQVRCQDRCQALCCRYLTVQIPAPRRECDLDEVSWLLAHEHVTIYVASRRWHLEVRTRCKYLTADNLCAIYAQRPQVCRDHRPHECEFPAPPRHTLEFDQREDFEAWRAKQQQQRRAKQRPRATKARAPG